MKGANNQSAPLFFEPCLKVPSRHYFVFGQEVDTSLVDEKDREACQAIYSRTRSCVARGIRYLLEARKHDPYGDDAKRILYETVMNTRASTHVELLSMQPNVVTEFSCGAGLKCSSCIDGYRIRGVSPSSYCCISRILFPIPCTLLAGTYVSPRCGKFRQSTAAARRRKSLHIRS